MRKQSNEQPTQKSNYYNIADQFADFWALPQKMEFIVGFNLVLEKTLHLVNAKLGN